MKKARFNIFKTKLNGFFDIVRNQYPETENLIREQKELLLSEFPEFKAEAVQQLDDKRKTYEKVKTTLKTTYDETRLQCYHGIEIKNSNPEECIETINIISRLIGNSHKEILYYSAQQGELLQKLKEINTTEGFNYLCQKQINLSKQHINFLIRFYCLIQEFAKLYLCILPLNFFNKILNIIREICKESGDEWK